MTSVGTMNVRPNCAEGKFYSSNPKELIETLKNAVDGQTNIIKYELKDKHIIGGVSPHAGHVFCANQAVHLFEIVKESPHEFDTVVLINPNHTGYGEAISLDNHSQWSSPLGVIDIDVELAKQMALPISPDGQKYEHSAEVILPFIQYFLGHEIKLLPINFFAQGWKNAQLLAKELYTAVNKTHRKVLVIASSDFNHFKEPTVGYELDSLALEALVSFELENFERRIKEHHISICGYGPILTLMEYARMCSSDAKIEILSRGHSGEVYPSNEVVDYVSIIVYS